MMGPLAMHLLACPASVQDEGTENLQGARDSIPVAFDVMTL
jgi:hypothetical protein